MAEDYEIIAAQLLRINSHDHATWNNWGAGIFGAAIAMGDDATESMFADAALKYAVACDLSPRTAIYWSNRAKALYHQALHADLGTAPVLFREATEALEQTIRLSPGDADLWLLAGLWYQERAEHTEAEHRAALLHTARVRFDVVLQLQPSRKGVRGVVAGLVFAQANCTDSANAPRLLMEVATMYDESARYSPSESVYWYLGAVALVGVADYLPDAPGVDGWLMDAHARMTEAISLKPDDAAYWQKRASVVQKQAHRLPLTQRDERLADADAEYAIAHRLDPQNDAILEWWAIVCTERIKIAENVADALAFAEEAGAKFEVLLKRTPDNFPYLINGTVVLHYQAIDDPANRLQYLKAAQEKLEAADQLETGNAVLLVNQAYNYLELARHDAEPDAENRLPQAEEKARNAVRVAPDSTDALINLAGVFTLRGKRENDAEQRAALFAEARTHLDSADALRPGVAAYSRAVIAALSADEADCERRLREAVEGGFVVNRRRAREDGDFQSVADALWFRQLLELSAQQKP